MLFKKNYDWRKIANSIDEIEKNENGIGVIELEGRRICITSFKGKWHAFAESCPHASSPLSEGWLDEKANIHCVVHGYAFNISNGYNSSGEGYHLSCWPVEERGDGVYIGLNRD